jgi:hypothetical protein
MLVRKGVNSSDTEKKNLVHGLKEPNVSNNTADKMACYYFLESCFLIKNTKTVSISHCVLHTVINTVCFQAILSLFT